MIVFSTPVFAADINTWVSPNTQAVTTGNTATTTLYIKNQGSVWAMTCNQIDTYYGDVFQTSETINIDVNAGQTQSKAETIQTPSYGSGTLNVKFKVYCKTWLDSTPSTQFSDIFSVSYSPPPVSFSLIPSKSSTTLLVGQSETIRITMSNSMSSGYLTVLFNNIGNISFQADG